MPITQDRKQDLKREYLSDWLSHRIEYYRSEGMNEEDIQWRAEQDLLEYAKPIDFDVSDEEMQKFVEAEF